jgi:hypothetical protein
VLSCAQLWETPFPQVIVYLTVPADTWTATPKRHSFPRRRPYTCDHLRVFATFPTRHEVNYDAGQLTPVAVARSAALHPCTNAIVHCQQKKWTKSIRNCPSSRTSRTATDASHRNDHQSISQLGRTGSKKPASHCVMRLGLVPPRLSGHSREFLCRAVQDLPRERLTSQISSLRASH